ncbi:hypothetical protein [Alteromonas halophila]|uniref:Solute-binding protein family 3/N-terminal domain-containing protein n=1 Tax=Alteromonas halophila TaxID=516698 RepID=A0A918JL23_9ALTE|nr:hypothetical protein [Alteromonas halophila]GGW81182.1 hypothetical protein GCM10007391_12900 [Alteromonas halophila]
MLLLCGSVAASGDEDEPLIITVPAVVEGKAPLHSYIEQVLRLSLIRSAETQNETFIIKRDTPATQERQLRELDRDAINVTWSVLTQKREERYLPIPFPLLGGLFSYRVLVVNESNHEIGPDTSVTTLKKLTAIQGYDWPDKAIMEANGYKVKGAEYQLAFTLLRTGYVDYFPRAAVEAGSELALHEDLKVAEGPALYYPNNLVFFVSKKNKQLHERLYRGLQILQDSGELIALQKEHGLFQSACALLSGRQVISLHVQPSPLLSALQAHGFSLNCADILAN